ncbi:B12-binding domain/radical SAM domain-containing protein [Pyrodictium occultum]|uniref:B12-binding domain/radical SAM domain-containing protein n=1 Tax=Pyrodictium occultum TaxID=2309 RepID=A0A0V8RVL5_PYROC|nr:TIGR04013 family B12-binding domain/radical SAM domain-containing protein [Pyrodictium occultum]KSW12101.1 B12-binding domain/radical SAM domain-containing protein [Pyrodictium occultum]
MPERVALVARTLYGARNAFAHLAAALEDSGLLGQGLDLFFAEEDPVPLARRLEEKGYRPVLLYGVSTPVFLELMDEIAGAASRYPVVAGGPHAEGAYWQLLRLGVYAAVVGDGENAIVALAEHFLGERDISEVPNIAYMEGGGVFRVTRIELVDLDDYRPYSSRYQLYPPLEIMRGCPYSCRFCQVPWLFKSRVRFRSPGRAVEAARAYIEAGRRRIRFIAPIGFAYMSPRPGEPNPEALEELLRGVREAGGEPYLGSFPSETRPEYVTPKALRVVKRYAANRRVSVGLQSGSDKVLKAVGRGHTVEEALEAVELIHRHGLQAVVDIIFGLPGEDEEAVEATVEVIYRLAGMGARLRLHSFLPLPGTPLARARPRPVHPRYREAVRRLLGRGVVEGDWEWQEKIAPEIYCLTALDPAPTREPRPLEEARETCSRAWSRWSRLMAAAGAGPGVAESLSRGPRCL